MGIVIAYRNGQRGRFNERTWPIAQRAGWVLDDSAAQQKEETPLEVVDFLRKGVEFNVSKPEPVVEAAEAKPEKKAAVTAKPRTATKKKGSRK